MFIALFLLWLIFNGRITLEILLVGLAVSAALTCFWRFVFGPSRNLFFPPLRKVGAGAVYILGLIREMILCNIRVIGLILSGREVRPQLVTFRPKLEKETSRIVLANSITLTPGTITARMEGDTLCVHALDASLAEGLSGGPMARRLKKMEEM